MFRPKPIVLALIITMVGMAAAVIAYACGGGEEVIVYTQPNFINLTSKHKEDQIGFGYDNTNYFELLLEQYQPGFQESVNKASAEEWGPIEGPSPQVTLKNIISILEQRNVAPELIASLKEVPEYAYRDSYYYPSGACKSNTPANILLFLTTANNDPAVKGGFFELAKIRLDIGQICQRNRYDLDLIIAEIDALKARNVAGNYPDYLRGLTYFYSHQYGEAAKVFEDLVKKRPLPPSRIVAYFRKLFKRPPPNTWLPEISSYLTARSHLIKAQDKWEGYTYYRNGEPIKEIDQNELALAAKAFKTYLQEYPSGLYASSSRNIERKIFYLQNKTEDLNRILHAMMNSALDKAQKNKEPVEYKSLVEFRNYFAGEVEMQKDNPLLIAHFLLTQPAPADALNKLEAAKDRFAAYPDLFRFCKTLVLYTTKQYGALVKDIPKLNDKNETTVAIEAMRADAYERLGNKKQALGGWKNLQAVHPENYIQMRIAALYANDHNFHGMLNDNTIESEDLLKDFLHYAPSDQELETLVQQPGKRVKLVEEELLTRYLLKEEYSKFSELAERVGVKEYKALTGYTRQLAKEPKDPQALTEVAAYLYYNFNSAPYSEDGGNLWELLPYCKACQSFNKNPLVKSVKSPFQLFLTAEDEYKKAGVENQKEAKTLYFLVRCFRGGEYQERCKWNKEEKNSSKLWFNRLRSLYPESKWAKETSYYY